MPLEILTLPEDRELKDLLIRWGRSCNGNYIPLHFWVGCTSLESEYLPPAGEVYAGIEALLQASISRPRTKDMGLIDVAVMRLPERLRMAVALEFVVHKRMSLRRKLNALKVNQEGYVTLVTAGAKTVGRVLEVV